MSFSNFIYTKPLLKLSGEVLGGKLGWGFDIDAIEYVSQIIQELVNSGITPGLVIGGGNFFRGAKGILPFLRRHTADYIGMLATLMNALCFKENLLSKNIKTKVFSPFELTVCCSKYNIDDAKKALQEGYVNIFAGGTGSPYFSTDSAASLRAIEVGYDVLIKATKVDGIYDSDPKVFQNAKKFDTIKYSDVLKLNLHVMDLTAIALCQENKLPLIVLSLYQKNSILDACKGNNVGTKVVE